MTYTYVVKNAGDVTLTGIEVWDDNGTTGDTSDDWKVTCPKTSLAVDESMTCKAEGVKIDETTINIGTATGHAGDKDTLDADDAKVFVPNPRIYVSKTSSVETPYGGGGEVTYTYLVRNVGNVPLTAVTLGDDKCRPSARRQAIRTPMASSVSTETWTYTCTMTLTETTTNVGTATGHYGDETTIDAAETTVTVTSRVNHPQIYLLKKPSVTELPAAGGPVTYTYLVWNVGNAPLTDVTLVDDKCSAVTGPTGDTGARQVLGLDETWTYTCTMTLTATTTNIGTATGHAGDYESIDAAQATVTVLGGGGVAGETSVATAPPTDTVVTTTTGTGGSFPLLLLILGIIGTGAVVLTPRRVKR